PDARKRGAQIEIFAGEPRPTLAKHAGKGFYHVLIVEPYKQGVEILHKDLLTKEGIALCMEKLAPRGILCVHISNRYYKLAPVLADVVKSLGLACLNGHDNAPWGDRYQGGHYSSEWLMVARKTSNLASLKTPAGYEKALKQAKEFGDHFYYDGDFWTVPK